MIKNYMKVGLLAGNVIVVCLFFQLYSDGNRRWASSHDIRIR